MNSKQAIKHHKKISVIGALGFLLLIGAIAFFTNNWIADDYKEKVAVSVNNTAVLGKTQTSPGYQLQITSPTTTYRSQSLKTVSIRVKVKNTSTSVMQISPGLQFYLLDKNKTAYHYTGSYKGSQIIGGPLGTNQTFDQILDFDVPQSFKPTVLTFQLDGSADVTSISL